jgi:hypothetical protein
MDTNEVAQSKLRHPSSAAILAEALASEFEFIESIGGRAVFESGLFPEHKDGTNGK